MRGHPSDATSIIDICKESAHPAPVSPKRCGARNYVIEKSIDP